MPRTDRNRAPGLGNAVRRVAQLVDKWMARDVASRSIAPSTIDPRHLSLVDAEINAGLGKRRVRELTTDDIENWLDQLSEAGLARSGLKKFRSTLCQALEFGERRGAVNRNAASIAKLTPGARPTAERTELTPEQLRTFLTVCANERLGAMFAIQAMVGLRPGEADGLCWVAARSDRVLCAEIRRCPPPSCHPPLQGHDHDIFLHAARDDVTPVSSADHCDADR